MRLTDNAAFSFNNNPSTAVVICYIGNACGKHGTMDCSRSYKTDIFGACNLVCYTFSLKQTILCFGWRRNIHAWEIQVGLRQSFSLSPIFYSIYKNIKGHAVAQLFEALRYKPEGRGFHSRWCHWNFSLTWSFRQHYGPGVHSASNRNEYQKYFLAVKAGGA